MKYTRTDNGDETVLEIDGTLDAVTAPEIRAVVDQLVTERRRSVTLARATSCSTLRSDGMSASDSASSAGATDWRAPCRADRGKPLTRHTSSAR